MRILEYQAKFLFRQAGIPVPPGFVASRSKSPRRLPKCMAPPVIVKAQVAAGSRKEAGAVRIAATPEEAESAISGLLNGRFVSADGSSLEVRRVLVERLEDTVAEAYASVVLDRDSSAAFLLTSASGGTGVESSGRIRRTPLAVRDRERGLEPDLALRVAAGFGWPREAAERTADLLCRLTGVFFGHECVLAEVNPLGLTRDGRVVALDAKMEVDDYALFRHPEVTALASPGHPAEGAGLFGPDEWEAPETAGGSASGAPDPDRDWDRSAVVDRSESGAGRIPFIRLGGRVGLIANGAGLAMATADALAAAGLPAASFCDIGGAATPEDAARAVAAVLADPAPAVFLVHVFGGIVRCDAVADGVVKALSGSVRTPRCVVRFEGNRKEEGLAVLSASGLDIRVAESFEEAVRLAAEAG
jgi:succinyl-CoA synthetase beta subunit